MIIRKATDDDAEMVARLVASIQRMHHDQRPDCFKPANESNAAEL
ncbi:MAG TPA: hypothetical protein VNF05_01140 [Acidimicrobiales bacterium]|nr:hypothetical protein [Acidimicrobiales bacterium]